jgi:hypothetical protein
MNSDEAEEERRTFTRAIIKLGKQFDMLWAEQLPSTADHANEEERLLTLSQAIDRLVQEGGAAFVACALCNLGEEARMLHPERNRRSLKRSGGTE